MNQRKVAHIISDADIGGGQVYVLQLIKKIKEEFEIIVICPKVGYYVEEYKENCSRLYVLDWQQSPIQLLLAIRKILKQEQPEIVHNHLMKACVFGSFANFRSGKGKTYNSLHGDLVPNNYSRTQFAFFNSLNRIASLLKVHYLCISQAEQQILVAQGIAKNKLTVVYNGIDEDAFPYSPMAYREGDFFKVVCVARLHPAKGIFTLLDASKLLPKHIVIEIIGDGPLRLEVAQKIKQENLSNVKLHGFHKDVRPFLAAAHLFVLPSNWEGFGMAIVEAMAMGKAVISTKVGGIPEIVVHGKGGYLVAPQQVTKLAQYILTLSKDTSLLDEFGNYNRKRFESKFSLKIMIDQLRKLYSV